MSEPIQVRELLSAGMKQTTNKMFSSMGYDYIRVGKGFTWSDVEYIKSQCKHIPNTDKKHKYGVKEEYKFLNSGHIKFQITGKYITLCTCPAKMLRESNVIVATPDEMGKVLNRVERLTTLNFWDGNVTSLDFTWTLQSEEPYKQYRSILRTPTDYRHEEKEHGDYYNSKRIILQTYDKAERCNHSYTNEELSAFSGTFTPELFRAEIKMKKEVRKVLVDSKFWDMNKKRFLASDLTDVGTFCNLAKYSERYILRFLKPMKNTTPQIINSGYALLRVACLTDNGYALICSQYKDGGWSDEMFRLATKYYNEAKEYQRNEYLRKHLSEQVADILAEYEPKREIDAEAKRALAKLTSSKILSVPPTRRTLQRV